MAVGAHVAEGQPARHVAGLVGCDGLGADRRGVLQGAEVPVAVQESVDRRELEAVLQFHGVVAVDPIVETVVPRLSTQRNGHGTCQRFAIKPFLHSFHVYSGHHPNSQIRCIKLVLQASYKLKVM